MKRRRRGMQLSDEQQLIIGLVLVILVAVSLLYCLGFASLALRQAWDTAPLPWNGTEPPPEDLDVDTTPAVPPASPGPTPPP